MYGFRLHTSGPARQEIPDQQVRAVPKGHGCPSYRAQHAFTDGSACHVDDDVHMSDVNDDDDEYNHDDNNHDKVKNGPNPISLPSAVPAVSPVAVLPAHVAADYAALSPHEKTEIMHLLIQRGRLRGTALRDLVKLHDGVSSRDSDGKKPKSAKGMVAHFLEHRCTDNCLVGIKLAQAGGKNASCISDASFSSSATFLKLRMKARGTYRKRKRQSGIEDSNPSKRKKIGTPQAVFQIPAANDAPANAVPVNAAPEHDPFRILTWEEKTQIMKEYKEATSKRALLRVECSFCGALELNTASHRISCSELDISLLETAVMRLRELCSQPQMCAFNPATIVNGTYVLCTPC